jgi:hypothetical protein
MTIDYRGEKALPTYSYTYSYTRLSLSGTPREIRVYEYVHEYGNTKFGSLLSCAPFERRAESQKDACALPALCS